MRVSIKTHIQKHAEKEKMYARATRARKEEVSHIVAFFDMRHLKKQAGTVYRYFSRSLKDFG